LIFDETCVSVKLIPAYRYATLRITDPFADPFERIGGGWRFLANWLQHHEVPTEPGLSGEPADCQQAACLEEVLEIDGVTVMDIFIPLERISGITL
jgi:AraC family transcriptional regulator